MFIVLIFLNRHFITIVTCRNPFIQKGFLLNQKTLYKGNLDLEPWSATISLTYFTLERACFPLFNLLFSHFIIFWFNGHNRPSNISSYFYKEISYMDTRETRKKKQSCFRQFPHRYLCSQKFCCITPTAMKINLEENFIHILKTFKINLSLISAWPIAFWRCFLKNKFIIWAENLKLCCFYPRFVVLRRI